MAVKFRVKYKIVSSFKDYKSLKKAVYLISFETNPNVVGQLFNNSSILKLTDFK